MNKYKFNVGDQVELIHPDRVKNSELYTDVMYEAYFIIQRIGIYSGRESVWVKATPKLKDIPSDYEWVLIEEDIFLSIDFPPVKLRITYE